MAKQCEGTFKLGLSSSFWGFDLSFVFGWSLPNAEFFSLGTSQEKNPQFSLSYACHVFSPSKRTVRCSSIYPSIPVFAMSARDTPCKKHPKLAISTQHFQNFHAKDSKCRYVFSPIQFHFSCSAHMCLFSFFVQN